MSYESIVATVVKAVPELGPALAEHIDDNDEVLPHLFFGCDVVPFVLAAWKAGEADVVRRCLDVLEAALASSDERTRELVSVSFVESIGPWEPDVQPFVATWPERLAREAC